MSSRLPLVIILGATGSGKTKLSLELAKKFGGEIIGADSMQVYKGLDIITAKATPEEQSLVPHHMINILEPQETFSVIEYQTKTLKIIENLLQNGKLPIVVGGTNYYIESLLWKILLDDKNFDDTPGILANNDHELSSEILHEKLKKLDSAMACRLHPNNKRKILRSLEVLYKNGRKHSEILEEQQSAKDASPSGGGLRFHDSLVLWLQCDQGILDKRLNERVVSMIEQGLLKELLNFHKMYNEDRIKTESEPDYTRGIFQSIGFKEFHPYLMQNEEERTSEEGMKKLNEGIELLKMATRRYARKQKRWIVNRFLSRRDRQIPPLYGLDASNVSQWNEKVRNVAFEIVESYVSGRECAHSRLPMKSDGQSVANSLDMSHTCHVCDRVFIGDFQWSIHQKSHKHRKMVEAKKKLNK